MLYAILAHHKHDMAAAYTVDRSSLKYTFYESVKELLYEYQFKKRFAAVLNIYT
jgi:hypothetical protein